MVPYEDVSQRYGGLNAFLPHQPESTLGIGQTEGLSASTLTLVFNVWGIYIALQNEHLNLSLTSVRQDFYLNIYP